MQKGIKLNFMQYFDKKTNIIQNRSTFDMKFMNFCGEIREISCKMHFSKVAQKLIFARKTAKFPK